MPLTKMNFVAHTETNSKVVNEAGIYMDLVHYFFENGTSESDLPKAILEFLNQNDLCSGGFCLRKDENNKFNICAYFTGYDTRVIQHRIPVHQVCIQDDVLQRSIANGFVTINHPEDLTFGGLEMPYRQALLFSVSENCLWGMVFQVELRVDEYQYVISLGRAISRIVGKILEQEIVNKTLEQQLLQQKEEIQSQLEHITEQANILTAQKQDIEDSLIYASRIQSTVLQERISLKTHIDKSFIIYRPKDFLSGDFYWWGKIGSTLLLVVADCTGHGIPGAMISFLGINVLNNLLISTEETDPAQILTLLNFRLVCSLQPDNTEHKLLDGMEVGICAYDLNTGKLTFAGANSTLYHERNGNLNVIKGDRHPIAGLPLPNEENDILMRLYENQEVRLQKNDRIYMTTDGILDQHGVTDEGKIKKLGKKQLTQLFQQYRQYPFQEVSNRLNAEIDNWQQTMTQTDDILILGFEC